MTIADVPHKTCPIAAVQGGPSGDIQALLADFAIRAAGAGHKIAGVVEVATAEPIGTCGRRALRDLTTGAVTSISQRLRTRLDSVQSRPVRAGRSLRGGGASDCRRCRPRHSQQVRQAGSRARWIERCVSWRNQRRIAGAYGCIAADVTGLAPIRRLAFAVPAGGYRVHRGMVVGYQFHNAVVGRGVADLFRRVSSAGPTRLVGARKQPSREQDAMAATEPEASSVELTIRLGNGGRLTAEDLALIEVIRKERSILAAARATGVSYRKCWLMVDALNRTFETPVLATHPGRRGGGAELTPFGERLVALYKSMERRSRTATAMAVAELTASLDPAYRPRAIAGASEHRQPRSHSSRWRRS